MSSRVHAMRDTTLIQLSLFEHLIGIVALPLCCLLQIEGRFSGRLDEFIQSGNTDELDRKVVYPCARSLVTAAKIKVFHDYHVRLEIYDSTPEVVNLVSHLKRIELQLTRISDTRVSVACHHAGVNGDNLQWLSPSLSFYRRPCVMVDYAYLVVP